MSGAYVVNAIYRAKEGEQEALAEHLRSMVPHSRSEPGCLQYHIHRSVEDPREFLLYEQYASEDDFEHHKNTEAFDTHIRQGAWPLLESRNASFWHALGD